MTQIVKLTLGLSRPTGNSKETKRGAGQSGSSAMDHKLGNDIKQKIFERDHHTCKSCGFIAKKYQDVHFLNHNRFDKSEKNLVTLCIFCAQCFNLEDVSTMRSGFLIWLPEIDQARLHHMARAIYVARISQGPMADAARKALDAIMERREECKKRLGTDDPFILAEVFRDYLGEKHYAARDKKLEGLRLFPLDRRIIKEADLEFNQFPQILAYWRSKDGPFGGKSPPQWIPLYQSILKSS
jgi:intracellular multiplication protein IcmJ